MPALFDPALIDALPDAGPSRQRGAFRHAVRRLIGIDDDYQQMRALARLDDDRLADLGLSRVDVEAELVRAGYRR